MTLGQGLAHTLRLGPEHDDKEPVNYTGLIVVD